MIIFISFIINLLLVTSNPPGTIKVGQFYVDKVEISNIGWREYQHYRKQELGESEYWKITPDSLNSWYDLDDKRFEPITLITFEQALDYCKWRSEVVSDRLEMDIVYRLPTIDEWNSISETLLEKDENRIVRALNKLEKELDKMKDQYFLIARESPKNKVYDLYSNVSEMTATKGIAKGGNNYEIMEQKNLQDNIQYSKPSPYLGFRCIAEIRYANTDR